MKRTFAAGSATLLAAVGFAVGASLAGADGPGGDFVPGATVGPGDHVPICHALGNGGYESIAPSAGVVFGHAGASHQDGRDIIPPFTYQPNKGDPDTSLAAGQNWAAGATAWANGCVEHAATTEPTTTTAPVTTTEEPVTTTTPATTTTPLTTTEPVTTTEPTTTTQPPTTTEQATTTEEATTTTTEPATSTAAEPAETAPFEPPLLPATRTTTTKTTTTVPKPAAPAKAAKKAVAAKAAPYQPPKLPKAGSAAPGGLAYTP